MTENVPVAPRKLTAPTFRVVQINNIVAFAKDGAWTRLYACFHS